MVAIFTLLQRSRRIHFMLKSQLKYAQCIWGHILLLALILTGCGSSPSAQNQHTATGATPPAKSEVPTVTAGPACNKQVCLIPADAPGVHPFINTFSNIHQAQVFIYNMTDASATQTAKNYDFVWGADVGT